MKVLEILAWILQGINRPVNISTLLWIPVTTCLLPAINALYPIAATGEAWASPDIDAASSLIDDPYEIHVSYMPIWYAILNHRTWEYPGKIVVILRQV